MRAERAELELDPGIDATGATHRVATTVGFATITNDVTRAVAVTFTRS